MSAAQTTAYRLLLAAPLTAAQLGRRLGMTPNQTRLQRAQERCARVLERTTR